MGKKKEKKKVGKTKKKEQKVSKRGGGSAKQLKSEIKRLEKEIRKRDDLIRKLQKRSAPKASKEVASDDTADLLHSQRNESIAVVQRKAWERHQYLRQQYEQHLEENNPATTARRLANRDLIERFGDAAGYSAEELLDILS
jgi:hypothetical protein